MIIVIDGYNLLRHLYPEIKGYLTQQRKLFIQQLGYYKSKKSNSIKKIIVVFDAGPLSYATREIQSGIVVIFSGQKSNADEWIVNYMKKNQSKNILLVTKDHKLIEQCERYKIQSMDTAEFYLVLTTSMTQDVQTQLTEKNFKIKKYEPIKLNDMPAKNNQVFDQLMAQSSLDLPPKKDHDKDPKKGKKGKS